ncbi:Ig domain-containing protein, partial [Ottowia thiooxydans]
NFTVTADNGAAGSTGSRAYSFVVDPPPALAITPLTLPNATQGTAYTQTLTASGAPGPYSFALTAGSFPLGMSFNSAGVLSGTPTVPGTFNFTVTADNGAVGSTGSRAYTLVVGPASVAAVAVPAMSDLGLLLTGVVLAGLAALRMRRRI